MMSQKQPQSPSLIVMLAPVAIVLVVYSFAFYSPQQAKLRSAQTRFNALSETHHQTEHEITDLRIELGQLKKQMREVDAQLDEHQQVQGELSARRDQMRHELESHSLPAATMQSVTRLMEAHQLRVIESQQDPGAASQAERILKSVRDLLKEDPIPGKSDHSAHHHTTTGSQHKHFTREVYKLKVRGRFQDLQAALETLATQLEHVLPLSLQMEPMELNSSEARQSQRNWTLTIMV